MPGLYASVVISCCATSSIQCLGYMRRWLFPAVLLLAVSKNILTRTMVVGLLQSNEPILSFHPVCEDRALSIYFTHSDKCIKCYDKCIIGSEKVFRTFRMHGSTRDNSVPHNSLLVLR